MKNNDIDIINTPNKDGYFGMYGGKYVSELLAPLLEELEIAFNKISKDKIFQKQFIELTQNYAGRPTNLYYATNLSKKWGAKIYLKREDTLHTGAHKINNTLGQILLAKQMGKKRIIAETGAGQHGVATATACALFGLPCRIYMGNEDLRRQSLNGFRMKLMGAEVVGVGGEKGTLRDAINEALRDWSTNVDDTYYAIGSVVGPHPYPLIVRTFQEVIGKEARSQILKLENQIPDAVVACVGGGSNAIGIFRGFLKDTDTKLFGVEAGGRSFVTGEHSATLSKGKPGILQGALTYLLQNNEGQVSNVHSISAGLDYPGVGPEHSFLKDTGRVKYVSINDKDALDAFQELANSEGIIPALESSHAVAYAKKLAKQKEFKNKIIIVNLSGRGDKDVAEVMRLLENQNTNGH